MKLARISTVHGPAPAVLEGESWAVIRDMFDTELIKTGERIPLAQARLLAPTVPRIVLGMAHNSGPEDRKIPPQAFSKSSRTVVGPGSPIEIDTDLGSVNIEGELAIVFRDFARRLSPEEVPAAILGATIGNDVTAIDQIPLDEKMTQVKNGDGFTPLGPVIETDISWDNAPIDVAIDGVQAASGSTAGLAWTIAEQVSYLTRYLTFGPGDVLLTGSPQTAAPVMPGQNVSITIPQIGTLENPVVALSGSVSQS
ncbi:fumarylacetoacetate hydrolase family protein [Bifidobacterium sp.]|uniref:fumarylacetoacetate hydrolase family protein n=1 Tax=Bifidobacterium sp. TaxID=41200 RepID=UPI0039EA7AAA